MPVVADIVKITAPSSAPSGETVIVDVSVKNISSTDKYIAVTGVFDSTNLSWQFNDLLVSPGQTVIMRGWFTMPSKNVRVTAKSQYWDGSKWVQDDAVYVDIALFVAPVVYKGSITKKELDYQNIWQPLPLYDIPVGTRTRMRVWGRNDMSTNQKMGIYWFVADPEGYVVQEHYDWETFSTGPGLEQGFVGSGFDLNKVGKYTTWVELLMNPDDPQVVAQYIGDLCTVKAAVPSPEFKAGSFAISEYDRVS